MLKHERVVRAFVGTVVVGALMAIGGPAGAAVDQVSGIADAEVVCEGAGFEGSYDYVIPMSGDLEGCSYGVITESKFLPSGVYHEKADETFVGTYQGEEGTFELVEDFIIKFDRDGVPQFGRCHHPIVRGSGTGVFEGVSGRLDYQDDFSDPEHPITTWKGHLKFD